MKYGMVQFEFIRIVRFAKCRTVEASQLHASRTRFALPYHKFEQNRYIKKGQFITSYIPIFPLNLRL